MNVIPRGSRAPQCSIVNLGNSPFTRLVPTGVACVELSDGFWLPRIQQNSTVTIPAQLRQCEETGRINNFLRAAGNTEIPFVGIFFNDSDVYKWVEAASFTFAYWPTPEREKELDQVIATIAGAQQPDGYLNTYFMFEKESERFTNLKDMHEIYCAGHLFQAAIAHHRATGKRSLLDVACRLADHLDRQFGPGKRVGTCGHEEAEMGLVELYRETGERRYLLLARAMIDARGLTPGIFGNSTYHQDHLPFGEQTELVGHAVRHLYYLCGASDVATEIDLPAYRAALSKLWEDLALRKMYVTGGAGSRYEGEAFGGAYELPNERAYTETCAAIASVMWNWRMVNITGEAKYADLMELTLYNAVLPGLSLDGLKYFYQNPLADRGKHRRQDWFGCACCPPNIARLLASISGYFYSTSADGIFVHMYSSSRALMTLQNGAPVSLSQHTTYPWDGEIIFDVGLPDGHKTSLYLRIPDWVGVGDAAIELDGNKFDIPNNSAGSYVAVEVIDGSKVTLTLPMPIRRLLSHPHVTGNLGRVALKRGPLIYCIEQADHEADVWDIALPDDAELEAQFHPELLGGVTVITGEAVAIPPASQALYAQYSPDEEVAAAPVTLTAIPYFAWANRPAGPMQVWIPTLPALGLDDVNI